MNVIKYGLIGVSFIILASCGTTTPVQDNSVAVQDVFYVADPEPVAGRVDVYNSMARGVKYNLNAVLPETRQKLSYQTQGNPRAVIDQVLNLKNEAANPLYDSLRILDFAIAYAADNLSADSVWREEILQAKVAQNLALASIKAHKDALFAEKKLKEIRRMMAKEQKRLDELNKKQQRAGMLNSDDLEYKKGLEVALYKMDKITAALSQNIEDYRQIAKIDVKPLELEGRRFYELEDLDAKLKADNFQQSALLNRKEYALQNELNRKYSPAQFSAFLIEDYPEVERLRINGYSTEDPLYLTNLNQRAKKQSEQLVNKVLAYKQSTSKNQQTMLREQAYEEMGTAILTQVEVAYDVVRRADADYAELVKQIREAKKNIQNAGKKYRMSVSDKVDLLEAQVDLLNMEQRESQMMAERAVALRALYFYAGFSPFNETLLQSKIKDMSANLKVGFNRDMVEMLAAAQKPEKETAPQVNDWAKQDNWLEKLLDGQNGKKAAKITVPQKSYDNFEPYGEEYNSKKIMQLGSYRQKENADLEWQMLKQLYPKLGGFSPVVERTKVNGQLMYRLVLKSTQGGWRELCNNLRRDRVDCILR